MQTTITCLTLSIMFFTTAAVLFAKSRRIGD